MSRIGKRIINIPKETEVKIENSLVQITGKLGSLTKEFSPLINIFAKENELSTIRSNEEKHTKELHGTTNSLLQSMIIGVSKGFKKEIQIKGVGYRATIKGQKIEINAGYSHPVLLDIMAGVKIEIPKPIEIIISGIDKQLVGQMAAKIRDVRRPNPYSGKGIMYKDEHVIRKEGKAASK